jgi:DNA-directed RNA polymerase specialized sigma24 family protein
MTERPTRRVSIRGILKPGRTGSGKRRCPTRERWDAGHVAALLAKEPAAWCRLIEQLRWTILVRWPGLSPAARDEIRCDIVDRVTNRDMRLLRRLRHASALRAVLDRLVARVGSRIAGRERPRLESEASREGGSILSQIPDPGESSGDPGARRQRARVWLAEHRDDLTAEQVELVELRIWERRTYGEIAEILKKNPIACKQLFRRALQAIERIAKAEKRRAARTPPTESVKSRFPWQRSGGTPPIGAGPPDKWWKSQEKEEQCVHSGQRSWFSVECWFPLCGSAPLKATVETVGMPALVAQAETSV